MPQLPPRVELLAPAGGPDALRAAVRNGADAVYLGTTALNARRGAANFGPDELAEACRFAHLRGARVYLTANVVVLADEMRDALAMIAGAWEAGVDAVIVQDLGLLHALRESMPEVRVHASTQIDAHNAASVAALAELGVSRVTLARELSVAELTELAAASPVELESFVHGSLCFSHSGQCLMSSLIGQRSANRGLCAQPCRLPYDLVDADGSAVEVPGRYLLSPRDLAGITQLPGLVRSGVAALKIEGRMKSPEYVASVVSVYRAALDRALADPDAFAVTPAEHDRLTEAFSRGFTEGYLADIRDDGMMSYARPNNRGVSLARVSATGPGTATLVLERALESGDTIEFWTQSGRFAQPAGPLEVAGVAGVAAPARATVTVSVEQPVRPGDRVFRVANAALLEAARRTFAGHAEPRPVPARFHVRLRTGEPAFVAVEADGARGEASGPVVEPARTRAVTPDEVIEHVGRLGGTPYAADDFTLELDAGVGIGFSTLHALRRDAIAALDAVRLAPYAARGAVAAPAVPRVASAPPRTTERLRLVVAVADAALVEPVRRAGADRVLVAGAGPLPDGAGALLPRVAHEREVAALLEGAGHHPVAGNLGLLAAAGAAGAEPEADWGLNVVNPLAAESLRRLGASFVWASPELSGRQLAALVHASPLPVGVVVGGWLEVMVAEHCILQAAGPCSHACASCARRRGRWTLRDRKGYDFPVTTDAAGRAHVYNSVPLDLARALPEIADAGVTAVRLDLQLADADEAVRLTAAWRDRITACARGRRTALEAVVDPSTSGHFYRGVT